MVLANHNSTFGPYIKSYPIGQLYIFLATMKIGYILQAKLFILSSYKIILGRLWGKLI